MLAAGFFGQNAVAGVGRQQRVDDDFFGLLVDFGHKIIRLLDRHANGFDVQRSAIDDGACRARSLDGHIEHGV